MTPLHGRRWGASSSIGGCHHHQWCGAPSSMWGCRRDSPPSSRGGCHHQWWAAHIVKVSVPTSLVECGHDTPPSSIVPLSSIWGSHIINWGWLFAEGGSISDTSHRWGGLHCRYGGAPLSMWGCRHDTSPSSVAWCLLLQWGGLRWVPSIEDAGMLPSSIRDSPYINGVYWHDTHPPSMWGCSHRQWGEGVKPIHRRREGVPKVSCEVQA